MVTKPTNCMPLAAPMTTRIPEIRLAREDEMLSCVCKYFGTNVDNPPTVIPIMSIIMYIKL